MNYKKNYNNNSSNKNTNLIESENDGANNVQKNNNYETQKFDILNYFQSNNSKNNNCTTQSFRNMNNKTLINYLPRKNILGEISKIINNNIYKINLSFSNESFNQAKCVYAQKKKVHCM